MAFFNPEEQDKIKKSIQLAEHQTSGEIRVCVEKTCKIDPINRAAYFFKKLKMEKTQLRNGVLIYLAHKDKKFAIIGDEGIHRHSGDGFWEEVRETMKSHFKNGRILEGVLEAVNLSGSKLKEFFPYKQEDKNELSDDVYDQG